MKKLFILFAILFISFISNAQIYVTQRVHYINNYLYELTSQRLNYNITELIANESNNVFILDSCDDYLLDAICQNDSITLFYKSSSEKVHFKKVLAPIKFTAIEPFYIKTQYLKIDPFNKINYNLNDSMLVNERNQDVVSVYTFDSIEVAVSKINGYIRIYKNRNFFCDILSFKGINRYSMLRTDDKKYVSDRYGNKILFIVYSMGGFFSKGRTYLVEIDIFTGSVLFKSDFRDNTNAFYLSNGNIVIVSNGYNMIQNNVYLYDKKTKKIEFGLNGHILRNAILLSK